jgi:hypothetical protein
MTKHDTEALRHLIGRQFAIMCWTPNNSVDWKSFAADFCSLGNTLSSCTTSTTTYGRTLCEAHEPRSCALGS